MWRDDLLRKKAWTQSFNEKINQQLDEFYSTIPDTGLTDREQYLYDMAQNQFKMLYELLDHSKSLIDAQMMFIADAGETKQNTDTQM